MLVVDCDGIDVALVPWPDDESVLEPSFGLGGLGHPAYLLDLARLVIEEPAETTPRG